MTKEELIKFKTDYRLTWQRIADNIGMSKRMIENYYQGRNDIPLKVERAINDYKRELDRL